jgi:hypothetical protein
MSPKRMRPHSANGRTRMIYGHCVYYRVCGGQEVTGWDCGTESGDWFTRFLAKPDGDGSGERFRLLFNPGIDLREINRRPHLYVNWAKPQDRVSLCSSVICLMFSSQIILAVSHSRICRNRFVATK